MRNLVRLALSLLLMLGAVLFVTNPALGTDGGNEPPCVPKDAWTEVIEHPAETHIVHHPAIPAVTETIPAVPAVWTNFEPNDKHAPFDGPPSYPTDPRGTWSASKDLPPGHAGPDGVYQKGNGNGSWFYRQAAVPEQVIIVTPEVPAWDETVVDKEAWTETIEHPAVTCEEPPTQIALPDPPDPSDPCGPDNASWIAPESTEVFSWEVSEGSGHLVVTILTENTVFDDGTTSHDFGPALDSGDACPPGGEPEEPVDEPETPVIDKQPATPVLTSLPNTGRTDEGAIPKGLLIGLMLLVAGALGSTFTTRRSRA